MRLFHHAAGSGRPLIILHGLFGSGRNWENIAKDLSPDFQVFTVDLRNHGRSPHDPGMSYKDMADDVVELLDAESLDAPVLVGHSMGGKVAMTVSLSHPDRVGALVAVDIAPVTYPPRFEHLLGLLCDLPLDRISSRADADALLAESIADGRLRNFLLQNLVQSEGRYQWRLNLPAIMSNLDDIFGFPKFPAGTTFRRDTLFVKGALSNFVRAEDTSRILAYFPAARVVTIPMAGHWLQAEQPAALLSALRHFLSAI